MGLRYRTRPIRRCTSALELAPATGDPYLIACIAPVVRDGRVRVSAVRLDEGGLTEAHYGAGTDTVYEIGSLTKTMTAALFAQAVESGGLSPDTPVGSLLELRDSPAAGVTLEELASHRSGLPRIAPRRRDRASAILAVLQHRNPYTADVALLLTQARAAKLVDRGHFSYSNLGVALLGEALAAHAGLRFPELLRHQLFERLGMQQSTTPLTVDHLPPGAPTGFSADGKSEQPWTMNAYAPAGGVRSTPGDLACYARALLDGQAPGISALAPRWEVGNGARVGYAWFADRIGDITATWHNGMTAGFSSILALDRDRGAAVIVLANNAVPLDEIAMLVLQHAS